MRDKLNDLFVFQRGATKTEDKYFIKFSEISVLLKKTKHMRIQGMNNNIRFNKKLLTISIAGIFISAAQLGASVAFAENDDNLSGLARIAPGSAQTSFTRMFPELPAFAEATDTMRERAKSLGRAGGILDAMDDPSQTALQSILNPGANLDSLLTGNTFSIGNIHMTAGVTFFGQFLDHDITFDPKSKLLENSNPKRVTNFRTPAFDLDSVYGAGPEESEELYDASSGDILFKIEAIPGSEAVSRKGATRYDVPRDANNVAIVAEGRNDENIIISQFQLAMLRFHNAVTANVRANHADWTAVEVFNEARRQVRWHYQWIIVHEFLPLTIGQERTTKYMAEKVENLNPRIPIEFSVAAYRFGHSQVRPSYRLNFGPTGGPAFFGFIFDDSPANDGVANPNDFRGGKRAPNRFVDWQTFFDFGAPPEFAPNGVRSNKKIDTKITTRLFHLPGAGINSPAPGLPSDGVQSLASRNLIRHVNFGLPSGQAIAARLGVPALTAAQMPELASYGMDKSTPLWYYILKEAEVMENGLHLGPVGGHIVGKVFSTLLKADASSYVAAKPDWTPTLPSATPGSFRITDLLKFAGVVPPLN